MAYDNVKGVDITPEALERLGRIGGGSGGKEGQDSRLRALEVRFDTILPNLATKTDIAETKGAISEAKFATILASVAVGASVVGAVTLLTRPNEHIQQPQITQPAPIVIYPQTQPAPQSPPETKRDLKGRPASRE